MRDPTSPSGGARILVVDDEESVRCILNLLLTRSGYMIDQAVDGVDALDKFTRASGAYDLVLLDLHMPHMDGFQALRAMRQIRPEVKAVMLTGGMNDVEDAERVPVYQLHKPFNNERLLTTIRSILGATPVG